jgi:threonine 3-dehydrogenase
MDQMWAVVKTAPKETEFKKIAVPEPSGGQVLVRVEAAALCGTDLHVYHWNEWARGAGIRLPLVMGHECCGEVAGAGRDVEGVHVGDRVAVETHIPCGSCYQCRNGQQHICRRLTLFGLHMNGCFAEYAVMPAVCARRIPSAIPSRVGAVMEPLGTALRAAHETRVGGATAVVLGCGPIGLFAVASAAALGAAKIFATDIGAVRLEIATRMGADLALNPLEEDLVSTVLKATDGRGADVVIDASGSTAAIKEGFQCLRKGGRMALVGLPDRPLELELGSQVVFKEAEIIGIHGRRMFETWTMMENLLAAGKLDVLPAVTHLLPLTGWREGIGLASRGEACKVVFQP